MKKIIMSLGMIAFVGALVAGGTGAFFSDTESSIGNTFAAGDIDLKIDNTSYVTNNAGVLVASPENTWTMSDLTDELFFSFEDVKPGDIGEDTISIHAGTNDAFACMAADITATPDNGINDPEDDASDTTDGVLGGELQNFLNFSFWNDDGDNVFETGETVITALTGPASTIFAGAWSPIGTGAIPGNATRYVAKAWCFGTLTPAAVTQDNATTSGPLARGTGFTCDGSGSNNIAQTDGVTVDVSFQAVQARNNGQFLCSSLPAFTGTPVVGGVTNVVDDEDIDTVSPVNDSWFFYNDTNDTIMTINQFSGSGGVNDIVAGPGSFGAAQMTLHDSTARYNIATYKYDNVLLSTIDSLTYRVYDESSTPETPFLHFNVSFDGVDVWQGRLVQVPTGVVEDTWTTVDAKAGMWTKTNGNWPIGVNTGVPFSGSTARIWADIIADYPAAETRTTDSFFGVRVGHPGPATATGYVDWIEFDGETTDFEI